MVWTYTSGPYTVSSPVTVTLAGITGSVTHGSFIFNPASPTSSPSIASVTGGSLVDGTWSVHMLYTDAATGTVFQSAAAVGVVTSTATIPPILTTPATSTASSTVPIAFNLRGTPSLAAGAVSLSFTNQATNAVSTLSLGRTVTQSFTLDPTNLASSSSVTSVVGPTTLPDGTYNVTLTYADDEGHAPASATASSWTLERATPPPTALAVSGGGDGTPLVISYSLPVAALPGSATVSLVGPATVTLALADTTAGLHTLSVDPANLTIAGDVTAITPSPSATMLPAGTYSVAVGYQDYLGNAASTAQQAGVVVSAAPTSGPVAPPTPPTPPSPPAWSSPPSPAQFQAPSPPQSLETSTAPATASSNRFTIERGSGAADGSIVVEADLPGPGTVNLLATHEDIRSRASGRLTRALLEPGHDRFTWARAARTTAAGGPVILTLLPDAAGERLLARHRRLGWPLHVTLWVTYRPDGGRPRSIKTVVSVLRARAR